MARIKKYPSTNKIKLPFNGNGFYRWLRNNETFVDDNIKKINNNPTIPLFQSVTFTNKSLNALDSNVDNDILVFLPTIIENNSKLETTLVVFEANNATEWNVETGKSILVSSDLGFNNSDFELKHEQISKFSKPYDDKMKYDWFIPKFEGKKKLKEIIYDKNKDSQEALNKNRCVSGILNKLELKNIMTSDSKYISIHPMKAFCNIKDLETNKSTVEEHLTFLTIPLDKNRNPILLAGKDNEPKSVYYLESMWNPYWRKWTHHSKDVFDV